MRHLNLILFLFIAGPAYAGNVTTSSIYDLNPDATLGDVHPDSDRSILRRSRNSLRYSLDTSGLDVATPHTVWVVAFNYPQYCKTTPCSDADFPFVPGHDPRVQATFVNAGGGVSDVDGRGSFSGTVHAVIAGISGPEVVLGLGLLNPKRADVRLVLRSHGKPASFEDLLAALKTYRGGCNVDNFFQPTPCRDYQISIHLPATND